MGEIMMALSVAHGIWIWGQQGRKKDNGRDINGMKKMDMAEV